MTTNIKLKNQKNSDLKTQDPEQVALHHTAQFNLKHYVCLSSLTSSVTQI